MARREITVKLEQKRKRLKMYLDREEYLLSPDGVQSYGIGAGSGSRNVQRYNTDLADLQKMIKQLEDEIEELEQLAEGQRPRKAFGIVPKDW